MLSTLDPGPSTSPAMADPGKHILVNFDTALQALRRDVLLMGTLAERNLQNAMAGLFGEGYAVEVTGLEGTVQWQRRGTADLFLYIPYRLTITPRR